MVRSRTQTDLPDELIFRNRVKPSIEKYFALSEGRIRRMVRAVPPPHEGRSRSSRTLGAGCDGRFGSPDERSEADGKIAWSWPPDAEVKLAES